METSEFGASRLPRIHPRMAVARILARVGQAAGQNNRENEAKIGEKVTRAAMRGVTTRQLLRKDPKNGTSVLLKSFAVLPMMRKYAKPLLLPTTR